MALAEAFPEKLGFDRGLDKNFYFLPVTPRVPPPSRRIIWRRFRRVTARKREGVEQDSDVMKTESWNGALFRVGDFLILTPVGLSAPMSVWSISWHVTEDPHGHMQDSDLCSPFQFPSTYQGVPFEYAQPSAERVEISNLSNEKKCLLNSTLAMARGLTIVNCVQAQMQTED